MPSTLITCFITETSERNNHVSKCAGEAMQTNLKATSRYNGQFGKSVLMRKLDDPRGYFLANFNR